MVWRKEGIGWDSKEGRKRFFFEKRSKKLLIIRGWR
jgi:hypothetical protein